MIVNDNSNVSVYTIYSSTEPESTTTDDWYTGLTRRPADRPQTPAPSDIAWQHQHTRNTLAIHSQYTHNTLAIHSQHTHWHSQSVYLLIHTHNTHIDTLRVFTYWFTHTMSACVQPVFIAPRWTTPSRSDNLITFGEDSFTSQMTSHQQGQSK